MENQKNIENQTFLEKFGAFWFPALSCFKRRTTSDVVIPEEVTAVPDAVLVEPPKRVVKKVPLASPPGPNDLAIVDANSPAVLEEVRALTARVLTAEYLADLDPYTGKVCMALFVGASMEILHLDALPSTWEEVLRFLDPASGYDNARQILFALKNGPDNGIPYAFDGTLMSDLLSMHDGALETLLQRCRLVLKKAINVATTGQSGRVKRRRNGATVSIFSSQTIQRALGTIGKMEEKYVSQARQHLNAAAFEDGHRALPNIRRAILNLDRLTTAFENIAEPIAYLRTELALARAMPPEDFRISPILLVGDPGIGKTYLALQLADALGVPMEKISAGGTMGGFQLTGSHSSWGRSMPGSVFTMLANGRSATPVLVVDEADKIGDNQQYPVIPTLLDLLERNTARTFKDEFFDIPFDASHIIVVLTANDREAVPAPLLSRVSEYRVPRPGRDQRLRIIQAEFERLREKTRKRITLDVAAAARLAEQTDIDLRQTQRLVAESFARALMSGENIVSPGVGKKKAGQRMAMGFVG